MPVLIDTHCHLDPHYFPEGPGDVMARARAAHVVGFVVIGVGRDLKPAEEAIALAEQRSGDVMAVVGIHPHDAVTHSEEAHARLKSLAEHPKCVAVGEMGLDYHYDHSPREVQRTVFARLIALAREVKKPIVVHTREAADDTLALLASENAREVGGIIHCFSEDKSFAAKALDLGFDISFSGILTFKSARAIHEVAAWAPPDRILVETDSPYLAPVPLRGKPCEPAYVVHTARRLAELRGLSFDDVATLTTTNAERRFRHSFRGAS